MKVVIYQDQKKITIDNISIPNISEITEQLGQNERAAMSTQDLQLHNFQITSTRGVTLEDAMTDEDLAREIEEGINWQQETVN